MRERKRLRLIPLAEYDGVNNHNKEPKMLFVKVYAEKDAVKDEEYLASFSFLDCQGWQADKLCEYLCNTRPHQKIILTEVKHDANGKIYENTIWEGKKE